MTTSPRIAVVGAGLGGLALARGLQLQGRSVTVFEREASRDARFQGGTLDLHADTGQAALRAVGLLEQFRAHARTEGQEMRAVDPRTAALLRHDRPAPGDDYAPEMDRGELRALFMAALRPQTIRWGQGVTAVLPQVDGTVSVSFADGTSAEFDLVVGADGAWSKVRPAVSDAVPRYTGTTFVETELADVDDRHPAVARLVGDGTLTATRPDEIELMAMRNSGGRVMVYVLLHVPIDWHDTEGLDLDDSEAVRAHLLGRLDGWHPDLLALVRDSDTGFVLRPLHVLPVGHTWAHTRGITLVGDAAHLMPPVGVGANLALLDGTDLATAIATHTDLDAAVRAYETVAIRRGGAAAQAAADLAEILEHEETVDVDAIRRTLNAQILAAS